MTIFRGLFTSLGRTEEQTGAQRVPITESNTIIFNIPAVKSAWRTLPSMLCYHKPSASLEMWVRACGGNTNQSRLLSSSHQNIFREVFAAINFHQGEIFLIFSKNLTDFIRKPGKIFWYLFTHLEPDIINFVRPPFCFFDMLNYQLSSGSIHRSDFILEKKILSLLWCFEGSQASVSVSYCVSEFTVSAPKCSFQLKPWRTFVSVIYTGISGYLRQRIIASQIENLEEIV